MIFRQNYNLIFAGKGKGTPALKNGIKCFKVDPEYDSDAMSDWQGF